MLGTRDLRARRAGLHDAFSSSTFLCHYRLRGAVSVIPDAYLEPWTKYTLTTHMYQYNVYYLTFTKPAHGQGAGQGFCSADLGATTQGESSSLHS